MSKQEVAQGEKEVDEFTGTFYSVLRANGYTVKQATELEVWRRKKLDRINHTLAQITLRRAVPIEIFESVGGYKEVSLKKREHILWMAGLNIKKYPYHKDIGEYHIGNNRKVGWFILGQERTDKHWIEQRVDGVRVASNAAILGYKPQRKSK